MNTLKTITLDYDHVSLAFAYVVTNIREARNLSEDELARATGLDAAMCRGIESGAYGPSLYFLLRLAAALDHPPEELITATVERLAHLDREKRAADEAWDARRTPRA